MEPLLFLYAAGIWLALFVLALTNGALRESVYALKLGEYFYGMLSVQLLLCYYTLAITYLLINSVKSIAT